MQTAVTTTNMSTPISAVLNPGFKGVVDAKTLARYLLDVLIKISKENLPIKVYATQDITAKIGNILVSLGVKIRTVSAESMSPPYIYLFLEDGDIVVKTVDEGGKEVAVYKVPFTKFVEHFEHLYNLRRGGGGKKSKKEKVVKFVDEYSMTPETAEALIDILKNDLLGESPQN